MVGAAVRNVSSPVLVGRAPEAARLGRALTGLLHGEPRVVVISGEAGIGKTRLIDDCLRSAGPELQVLRGECLALGSGIPYLPFAEILRDLVRQVPSSAMAGILGSARGELARLLPELAPGTGEPRDTGGGRASGGADLERLRLYEAFLRVAERVATDHATVFVLEDVQWIDSASLELLSFLAHGLRQRNRATVIVSVRPEEVENKDAVLTLLADLGRDSTAERIELTPFTEEKTRELVAAILRVVPSDELAERIHALSDGNPLFVEELVAASATDPDNEGALPPKLRDLLAARLARVPDDVLTVLRIAAAAGRTIDDRLLVTASGLSADQVQRAVRAAVDDHVLVRVPGEAGYRFRHEILRALVASQLLPDEARHIHVAYARALMEEPADRRTATEVASHWDAAGEPVRALGAHLEAAQSARSTYAYDEARHHFQRALELWAHVPDAEAVCSMPRTALLAEAATATAKAGDLPTAIALTRQLIAEPGAIDLETYELARSSLRWYLWEAGDLQGALAEAEAASDNGVVATDLPRDEGVEPRAAGEGDGSAHLFAASTARWQANALAHRAGLLLYLRRTEEAARYAREALAAADAADAAEERILAEGVLGWCLLLEGEVEAGLAAIRRALEAAVATEGGRLVGRYPVGAALAHAQLATALELVGRYPDMHATAVAGATVAARQGVARTLGSGLQASAARALYQLGRWEEATRTVDDALRAGAVGAGRIALLAVRALLAVGRGDDELTARALADAERLSDTTTPIDVQRWLTAARAEDALWHADPMTALTRLALLADDSQARADVTPGGRPALLDASIPILLALGARACADIALQERASGAEPAFSSIAAEQLEASLRRVRRQPALAAAWAGDLTVARAELERAGRDLALRDRRWRTALDLVGQRPYLSAYASWRLAEARLARREGRAEAAPVIEAGLALADRLGAGRLATELRSLAHRARLSLATAAVTGHVAVSTQTDQRPFGLTAREAEVLALLAGGLSNQEIADRLFISPKTASVHVSNIYSKLGVESRVAAATLASGLGLTVPPADPAE